VEQKIKPEKNERHNVGGQAIIEGVMMRSPWKISIAVRKPNGTIMTDIKEKPILSKTNKFFALPIIRGVVNMVDSLIIGLKALSLSATLAMDEEEEKLSAFDVLSKGSFPGGTTSSTDLPIRDFSSLTGPTTMIRLIEETSLRASITYSIINLL
jgi:hypothetical protein